MSQRWHNEARLRATQHVHVELISMQTAIMDTPSDLEGTANARR